MTLARACLAAACAVALLLPQTSVASPHRHSKVSHRHHGHGAKARKRAHRASVRRMRWVERSAALRLDTNLLFGGSGVPGVPGAPGRSPGPGTQPGGPAPTASHAVSVASREFSLILSRPVLAPGLETVQLNNRGEDPHNLVVSPEGSHAALAEFPETGPDATHTMKIELPAGSYRLWCSLPGHEEAGMKATLRVE